MKSRETKKEQRKLSGKLSRYVYGFSTFPVPDDNTVHYTTIFDNSPLNRVWLQYGPGAAWNNAHPVTTEYYTNTDNGELACKLYITNGYTFSEGQTLLERCMNGTEQLDTYYVYDHYGRLCVVLQPEYQNEPDRAKYAFQYQYNERGLCIWKKLPGIQYVINEYNVADQLIFSQDGNRNAYPYRQWQTDTD